MSFRTVSMSRLATLGLALVISACGDDDAGSMGGGADPDGGDGGGSDSGDSGEPDSGATRDGGATDAGGAGASGDSGTVEDATADAVCDGDDGDADGQTDEGYAVTDTECGRGECAEAGELRCVDGEEVDDCEPGAPASSDASCNGDDDDCDGDVDEDYEPVNCDGDDSDECEEAETSCDDGQVVCGDDSDDLLDDDCNGDDDDCDGDVDEDFVSHGTTCGVDACESTGITACGAGGAEVDTCTPVPPAGTCGADVTGIFAIKTVIDVWWQDEKNEPDLIDPGRSTITVYLRGEIDQWQCGGSGGSGAIKACGTVLPPSKSYANCDAFQLTFPDELWDEPSMPTFAATVTATGFEPGDVLAIAEATALHGIDLPDPDGTWPASTAEGGFDILDDDGDGEPGITIEMARIGETFTEAGLCGASLPYIFRGAPLEAINAIIDDGEKAETLYVGWRSKLGGAGALGATCDSGVGDSSASLFDLRVFDCLTTQGRSCVDHPDYGTAARDFVDNAAPSYHILEAGEKPPETVIDPATSLPIDQTLSVGTKSALVRLDDLGGTVDCSMVRETDAACVAGVNTNSMSMAAPACATCVCLADPLSHTKCDANCWGLISCIGAMCGGDFMDTVCILGSCPDFLGETAMATAFGPTVMGCMTECQ